MDWESFYKNELKSLDNESDIKQLLYTFIENISTTKETLVLVTVRNRT